MTHPVVLLPDIVAPAAVRYRALVEELPHVPMHLHDLAVHEGSGAPDDYSIDTEVATLDRAIDDAGFERVHLFGHSGGGAVALAYAARHGERLISLAVDEPASDFTAAGDASYGWPAFDAALQLPPEQAMLQFVRLQLADDVRLPPRSDEPPPPWMHNRPAGIAAFVVALQGHRIDEHRYREFGQPVYFSRGSRSHSRWAGMEKRLAAAFPDFTAEVFPGLHHVNPALHADPIGTARTLSSFWDAAESGGPQSSGANTAT